jgi:ribosomal protein S18 acetylase RimI-like enzyme
MDIMRKSAEDLSNEEVSMIEDLLEELELEERHGYSKDGMPSYKSWNRPYSQNDVILAIVDSVVVGLIDFSVIDSTATMHVLVVSEGFRNQGIATKLYKELKKYLKNDTWADELHLSVRANNGAIEFYKKMGFISYHVEMYSNIL